jgi:hypothetical protein
MSDYATNRDLSAAEASFTFLGLYFVLRSDGAFQIADCHPHGRIAGACFLFGSGVENSSRIDFLLRRLDEL